MLFLISTLFAEEPTVVYKKETRIDFEAVDIEGLIKKPQGVTLLERSKAIFNPLVHIREDFLFEMEDSINQIK